MINSVLGSILAVNIIRIMCGAEHVLAISENGVLYTWGSSLQGQLGQGSVNIMYLFTHVSCLADL